MAGRGIKGALIVLALVTFTGCHAGAPSSASAGLSTTNASDGLLTQRIDVLDARCRIPLGWKPDPLKQSANHTHQVWISPSGHTAYGVIHFHLPWPVGHDLALWGFLSQMRASEGEATLESKQWDPKLNGLRFVADGGKYTVRTNLFAHGFTGWAVYAGTLREFPVMLDELLIAERARDQTVIDLP